jgi:phosphoserine phosphatase
MRGEEDIRRIIRHWEGVLRGIEAGQMVEVAEVFLNLPQEAQGVALELLAADPLVRQMTNREMDELVKPLIKEFIVTLRWVLEEEA